MSIERTYYCEAPDCEAHTRTATPPPYLPMGFLRVEVGESGGNVEHHFCGWECAMKYAATLPPPEIFEWDGDAP